MAEVGDLDLWQVAQIAVVCVSSSAGFADEVCQKVLTEIEHEEEALVTRSTFELVHV